MSSPYLPGRRFGARRIMRRLVAYLKNLILFALAAFFAFEMRFDGALPARYFHTMEVALCIWAAVKTAAFIVGSVNQEQWRHTSIYEAERIILANTAGSVVGGLAIFFLLGEWAVPRSVYVLEWILSCFLILGGRLTARLIATARKNRQAEGKRTRTLIYGAGAAGLALLWELRQNPSLMFNVVGLIDDSPQTVGLIFDGKPVLGTGEELGELTRKHGVKRVLIAIPSATGPQMVRILKFAIDAGVDYKMVPSLGELIQGTELGKQIRDVAVEDLLGRKPVQLDQHRHSRAHSGQGCHGDRRWRLDRFRDLPPDCAIPAFGPGRLRRCGNAAFPDRPRADKELSGSGISSRKLEISRAPTLCAA